VRRMRTTTRVTTTTNGQIASDRPCTHTRHPNSPTRSSLRDFLSTLLARHSLYSECILAIVRRYYAQQ
jgi:hypothetical protein